MIVDYLSNAFTPDRQPVWDNALAPLQVKIRTEANDTFADPQAMVARMDELGIATIVLPTGELHGISSTWPEAQSLAERWPGRFASLAIIDPTEGMKGVRDARARLADQWVVGLYAHTHSWDRRLDHADYYPYYALCSEADVPVAMQVGASGGLMASECGHPIGIDRPALYFPETRFVLSHTGYPWVDEAVAMAMKYPNVYIGTASYPPRYWPEALLGFLRGPGRNKVLFGTNFPTVGHRHALGQLKDLELGEDLEQQLLSDNARAVFTRLET